LQFSGIYDKFEAVQQVAKIYRRKE
jgi:hypothetical protein